VPGHFLGTAFGLALVGDGWTLHASPGEFHLDRNGHQIDPFQVMLQLSDGVISKEACSARCKELGIEGLRLSSAERTDSAGQGN